MKTRLAATNLIVEPIPDGYRAWDENQYDGPGSPIGVGGSEDEAVEDLREQIAEQRERK